MVLEDRGKLEEAEMLLRLSSDVHRKSEGINHPETLTSTDNLARVLEKLGRLEESEALYRKALEGRRRVLGVDHANTLKTTNNLAYILLLQGKTREFETLFENTAVFRWKDAGFRNYPQPKSWQIRFWTVASPATLNHSTGNC